MHGRTNPSKPERLSRLAEQESFYYVGAAASVGKFKQFGLSGLTVGSRAVRVTNHIWRLR